MTLTLRSEHPRGAPNLAKIVRALRRVTSPARGVSSRVDIVLVDDRAISRMAGKYRASPYPTDVLAFCYDDDPLLAGEIAVSIDTARRQAALRRVPLEEELTLLCIHGLLHVGGHDDETKRDWCAMRIAEFETLVRVL